MIAILDYGAGNLRSVKLALDRLGADTVVTRSAQEATAADGLILPGVGAFADAVAALEQSGLIPALEHAKESGQPLLGVCLGMQLLFESSEEGPGVPGLGFLPGTVKKLQGGVDRDGRPLKIPHMGWYVLTIEKDSPLTRALPPYSYVYFVHSYACHP
ncbi:MAG: imidazole glycerol phosphate synthase subunit HisH, partial [Clostridia bacterium]|nr:imidazole glycerol phosphate synthase subunit HisH [Clostridia bacterium]